MHAGLAVVHTAERVAAAGSSSSKKQPGKTQQQQQQHWLPMLPAARAALPAVLMHSEGADKTAQLVLQQFEEWQAQQPAAAAAAGHKQHKGTKQATSVAPGSVPATELPPLLALPALNSFLQQQ
jgi:hypothetical protein